MPRLKPSPLHLGQNTKGLGAFNFSSVKIVELDPFGSTVLSSPEQFLGALGGLGNLLVHVL